MIAMVSPAPVLHIGAGPACADAWTALGEAIAAPIRNPGYLNPEAQSVGEWLRRELQCKTAR